MLTAEIPADVHELDGIERAAALPGIAGAMRGDAVERVLDRDEARTPGPAPGHLHVAADMSEDHGVDVLEHAVAGKPGLGRDELFGDTRPDDDRAWQTLAFHDVLDRKRGRYVHGLA